MPTEGNIIIRRAKVNNLKDITVEIPRNRLVVVTGISGSGKSSLAFDTLFAEGQRRFAESLSSYARQFLGRMSKPDVEMIEGIPPAIAIEQKVNIRNPRSTVATTTEIYDFLRLLFARIGRTYSPVSGLEVRAHTVQDVLRPIFDGEAHTVYILSDIRWKDRKDKVELMLQLKEEGYGRFFDTDTQEVLRIEDVMQMDGHYPENLHLLVDRAKTKGDADEDLRTRLLSSVQTAFDKGGGDMSIVLDGTRKAFCSRFELDGMTFREPDEYLFSFNSPLGACPECGGLGKIIGISEDLVVPDKTKTIYDGAVACWRGDKMGWFKDLVVKNAEKYDIPVFVPYCKLTERQRNTLWTARSGGVTDESTIVGIDEFFEWVNQNRYKIQYKYMLSRYSGRTTCHACGGSRLRKEALYVRVGGKNIHELLSMTIDELLAFFERVKLTDYELGIAGKAIEEIVYRLRCIQDVGLGYLTLSRAMNTLSGGESQRVNLVTALGSSLVGSMYILDEPSIGLHPRDTDRLIAVLKRLRDIGNTVVVVEHDPEIIRAADLLIDMGPKAGVHGGEVVFKGVAEQFTPEELKRSLTLQYLTGERKPFVRAKRPWQYSITVNGAMQNNLKDIDVQFPLGVMTVVTGVSGSGKSSLVGDILYPALHRRINETGDLPGTFKGLSGNLDRITRVEYVDQNPIGKSSRSNAVTYLKVYDDIRKLLSEQQFARINGFTPSFFSFNQEGGRCPECQGDGFVKIGMQFMADVTMVCESCGGKRFKPEILEVRYRDKNIDDILNMSVEEAIAFFSSQPEDLAKSIAEQLQPLVDVGLGYIKLGQPSSTLSGGESQRIKLAYFLSLSKNDDRPRKDRILFMFDEPTTGLHFYDVEKLLKAFDALLSRGHSVVVVEHNLDVIRSADWVIDLGPDAGDRGGEVVFAGTPEDLVRQGKTFTGMYLRLTGTQFPQELPHS
ncbi:MAG: excinuclease ABC subunit UvrA [Bacteroidales bacterium]|nr:excinuclease ABC subunit UvrA [Bacteroidales bacterium]